jgi:hypothetical protein
VPADFGLWKVYAR